MKSQSHSALIAIRMPSGRVVEKVSESSYKQALGAAAKKLTEVKGSPPQKGK